MLIYRKWRTQKAPNVFFLISCVIFIRYFHSSKKWSLFFCGLEFHKMRSCPNSKFLKSLTIEHYFSLEFTQFGINVFLEKFPLLWLVNQINSLIEVFTISVGGLVDTSVGDPRLMCIMIFTNGQGVHLSLIFEELPKNINIRFWIYCHWFNCRQWPWYSNWVDRNPREKMLSEFCIMM